MTSTWPRPVVRFRRGPRFVTGEQDEQATPGASVLDCDPQ